MDINQKDNQSLKLHLIVDHHMNRAMCGVRWQVRQVKRLVHNTLACKRSVTVKQNRHHLWNHSSYYKHFHGNEMLLHEYRLGLLSCPQCLRSRTAQLWSFPAPLGPLLPGGTGWPWETSRCTCYWPGSFSCETSPSDISHHQSPATEDQERCNAIIVN